MAFQPREPLLPGELELFLEKVGIVVAVLIVLTLLCAARNVLILVFIAGAVIAQVAFEEVFVARRERRRDVSRAGTLTKRRN